MNALHAPVHVLLVDDSPDDNFFHQRAITKSGIDSVVTVASDGEEAISYLSDLDPSERVPDLIFLDINMPRMTGWEFLDAYAEFPSEVRTSAVLVMLTTSPHPKDEERARENALVADFINKPLTPELLRELVARFLDTDD